MKRPGRYRRSARLRARPVLAGIVGVAIASLLVALGACSNNGEGDRCNFDNGDDDCQEGLVCLPASNQGGRGAGLGTVNPPYNNSDRCCQPDRTRASHPACTLPSSPIATDSGPPPDTGPTTPDATVDAPDDG